MLDQIMLYIRENADIIAAASGAVAFCLLLFILFQVTRTRREVHKICKKIRKYFDVVFSEEVPEEKPEKEVSEEVQVPVYQTLDEQQMRKEAQKRAEDAKLLMDVISEVF